MSAEALTQSLAKARGDWLSWMRATLMGPRVGEEEVIDRSPLNVYCCGILVPADLPASPDGEKQAKAEDAVQEDFPGASSLAEEPDTEEELDTDASAVLPSASVGLSFLVTPDVRIEIAVSAGTYDRKDSRTASGSTPEPENEGDDGSVGADDVDNTYDDSSNQERSVRWHRVSVATAPGECVLAPPSQPTTLRLPILSGKA